MQVRPGGPQEEVSVKVHPSPVDLVDIPGGEAGLDPQDLVLGVWADGQALAFPVAVLANYEVVSHRVGSLPVAPTW
jgi:hypothetical protein